MEQKKEEENYDKIMERRLDIRVEEDESMKGIINEIVCKGKTTVVYKDDAIFENGQRRTNEAKE